MIALRSRQDDAQTVRMFFIQPLELLAAVSSAVCSTMMRMAANASRCSGITMSGSRRHGKLGRRSPDCGDRRFRDTFAGDCLARL